jgi:ABC-type phosphate transport system permease subunit
MIEQDKLEDLTKNINSYVKTNLDLIKYQVTERTCVIGSKIIANLILLLVIVLLIIFFSLGASIYLSNYFGYNYLGYIIVAGFYFLIGLILLIGKGSLMERPLREKIIRNTFNKD